MQQGLAVSGNDLNIIASRTSSHTDFDFWFGKWKIQNRKLKERLKNSDDWEEFEAVGECRGILNGFGNTDTFKANINGEVFEGMTLRLFDPKTRLWSIHWASNTNPVLDVPQVGSWDGNIGKFYARDIWEGTPIIVRFDWERDPIHPRWSQAFSTDDGKTWEWNWYMKMTKMA